MINIETFIIKDWEDVETGVLLSENEEWVFIKSIPVDFQVDGYKLIRKSFIEEREEAENSEILKKVFELKKIELSKPKDFEFGSVLQMLKNIENKYGCFEFQDEIEDELFYGVLNGYDLETFHIDSIKSDGRIDSDFDVDFNIKDIRTISFESDYFNAISLLYNYNKAE